MGIFFNCAESNTPNSENPIDLKVFGSLPNIADITIWLLKALRGRVNPEGTIAKGTAVETYLVLTIGQFGLILSL